MMLDKLETATTYEKLEAAYDGAVNTHNIGFPSSKGKSKVVSTSEAEINTHIETYEAKKEESNATVFRLIATAAIVPVALLMPFMVVPYLTRLPYQHTPNKRLHLLFENILPRVLSKENRKNISMVNLPRAASSFKSKSLQRNTPTELGTNKILSSQRKYWHEEKNGAKDAHGKTYFSNPERKNILDYNEDDSPLSNIKEKENRITPVEMENRTIQKASKIYKFIDLGSGAGELVFKASTKGMISTGIELNPVLWLYSTLTSIKYHPFFNSCIISKPTFQLGNFWSISLKEYDIIIVFGVRSLMRGLETKILQECKDTAIIISYRFEFPLQESVSILHENNDTSFYYRCCLSKAN